uniref:Minor tail protein n=1 Tax=Siphoviridae sp. ctBeL15 TaxID=2825374 RepID=A0A8S5UZV0_9CAUD|nr:MAG TPA: minor tail protein [Siphoviridae sp. ctBeL15]
MAIFKVTAVPDFSQLKSEIAKLQNSPVTLGVDTQQANVSIKATAKEIKNAGKAAKETSGFADLMGDSFGRVAAKMAMWQLLGNAIAGVKRSFVEALDTMKSVDDEMVTIRKVTGATTAELNKIEKQAYDTASAYGVAADEYLQFVSGFSRAGYGEQASALAELAAKTQIVGDTNAETAQQFLLSVDAAYKYQGSIEQLTKVLDGANEIDNKYATSIQKVAEGLGKVAPIAAQAHVGVDELTAAIGTITAVTQRSGTEASTALRALFLNIIGDTKTEIDEGVTWTTGEIAGLRDVIKVYAKDAYDAAQATGSVINPMKAIAGLSKSMKDGLLTEQQLMEMVSDIGGKLRTSQLLALIQNWDMYQSMLGDFADAAGSADKEVENALDSWTRKTEILKNKWTQFVSNLVETDTIKDALDGVIGLVEFLDSDLGHLTLTIGGVTLAVVALSAAKEKLSKNEAVKGIGKIFSDIKNLGSAMGGNEEAAKGLGKLGTAILNLGLSVGQLGLIAAGIVGLVVVVKSLADANDKANRSMSDFDTEIGETNEQLKANKERLDEINSTPWNERSVEIIKEKNALEAENEALQEQLELLQKQKLEKAQNSTGEGFQFGFTNGSEAYETILNYLDKYTEQLERTGQVEESQQLAFEKTTEAAASQVEMLQYLKDNGKTLTNQEEALIAAYERLGSVIPGTTDAMAEYVSGLLEEARQSDKTEKEIYDLVAAQIAASNQGLNFSQQIAALQQLGYQAGLTAQQVSMATGMLGTYQDQRNIERTIKGLMQTEKLTRAQAEARVYSGMQHALWTGISQNGGWGGNSYAPSGGGYSGGSGSSGSSRKTELDNARKKAAQATIDAIKRQRDAETDAIDEQIEALKKQNEETERGEKLEELKLNILKKQDELLNARNERTVRQYNAATGQWEWVADAQKVKDAEEALEDAKKDLRDYERDTERELAIEELEARKKAIEAAYQLKIDTWQKLIDELNGDVETEKALLAASRGDWETYYQEMLKVYQKLLDAAQDYEDKKQKIQNSGNTGGDTTGGGSGGVDGDGDDSSKGNDTGDDNKSSPTSEVDRLTPAQRIIYDMWMRRGVGTYEALRQAKQNASDKVKDNFDKTAESSKDYEKTTIGKLDGLTKKDTGSSGSTSGSGVKKPSNGGNTLGGGKNINKVSQYDSGGVLHGLGGIKATVDDEMVLPPDVTRKLLTPSAENRAMEVISGMRLALNDRTPYGQSLAGVTNNSSDSHDVSYYVNGVPIAPEMAKLPMEQIVRQLNMAAFQGQVFNGW